MAARKFKFVSPGVFLKEIDNSQLPKEPGAIGPVIIGRTRKGPALKPFTVSSYSDFVEIFGNPIAGGKGSDVYREGNGLLATAPAHYAAKAYFAADIASPVTVVRLLGIEADDASTFGQAGWTSELSYGLFAAVSSSNNVVAHTASLVGIIYGTEPNTTNFDVALKGTSMQPLAGKDTGPVVHTTGSDIGMFVLPDTDNRYTLYLSSSTDNGAASKQIKISFENDKDFIRNVLNTNPLYSNTHITTNAPQHSDKYWLGETFERTFQEVKNSAKPGEKVVLAVARLNDAEDKNLSDFTTGMRAARTGWIFHQNTEASTSYDPDNFDKLFRIIALHEGEEASRDTVVSIEDIRIPPEGAADPYGSFSVVVSRILGSGLEVVETFPGCNLNPNSQNYVAKQVGDQYLEWSTAEKRNKLYGSNPNNSRYIRIHMDPDVDAGNLRNPSYVPFGFFGPVVPSDVAIQRSTGTATVVAENTFLDKGAKLQWPGSSDKHLRLQWSRLPTVVSASLRGTDPFGAAVYKVDPSGNLSDQLDYGYVDFVRSLPVAYSADTVSGDASVGEYAFKFSMDEIYLSGTNLGDPESALIKKAFFQPGSHLGIGEIAEVPAVTAATASVRIDVGAIGSEEIGETVTGSIQITDNEGDDLVLVIVSGSRNMVTGSTVFHEGGATPEIVEGLIVEAVNNFGPNGLETVNLTASIESSMVLIESTVSGSAGNTTIVSASLSNDILIKKGDKANFPADNPETSMTAGVDAVAASPARPEVSAYTAQFSASLLTELGFDKFRLPLVGGFDGVDITEADPFNNRVLRAATDSGNSPTANSYAYASVDRAIELVRDPEAVEHNLAVMPGITNDNLTTKLVRTCESRADSLAIIDLKDIYVPPAEEKCSTFKNRIKTTPTKAAKALTARQINSSYGAAYYPWVKVKDDENNTDVWVPPSVIALGVMAYTEERDDVWFAPAGFNRGGLNEGNAGLPVLQASEQLLSKQRDTLYEANINPIASFVSEGIVVFGQKTLQTTRSALDRINVRRLLIFVKKEISRISNGLLFDQNVRATWNRFLGQVVPFLESVKARLGLADFRVILDETTTTPDLIDRNVMYAKIFLKPARAIEFIAVDFVITNTGASFED